MATNKGIPTYSLNEFSNWIGDNQPYQVEVFDANRHFEVQYPHRHDFFEVLFLTKGSGLHIIDQNQYTIAPPCIFFLSPGQAHSVDLSEDIGGYIFLFTAEFYLLNKHNKNRLLELPFFFSNTHSNKPLVLHKDQDLNFLIALFNRGAEMCKDKRESAATINALLDVVLNYCNDIFPNTAQNKLENTPGQLLVKRFRQMIEEKYQQNPTIQQYADWLHVSPNHLTQTVKSVIGKTSLDLIKERSIIEIKRLLVHSEFSISEIADQLNYKDQSYFTKFFKKHTGQTPNAFRANH